ncbi:MAG: sialidase family protein [Planctomycetota bacterium]
MVWSRQTDNFEVQFNVTADGGATMQYAIDRPLDRVGRQDRAASLAPSLACLRGSDGMAVCWADGQPDESIWFSRSADGGTTWTDKPTRVSGADSCGGSEPADHMPGIGYTSYGWVVAWQNPRGSATADVYSSWSADWDNGKRWRDRTRLNRGSAASGSLRVAASPLDSMGVAGPVLCGWLEERPGGGATIRVRRIALQAMGGPAGG